MLYRLNDKSVELRGDGHFVAPSAEVMGQVILEAQASVWFNAVVRGDNDVIHIGPRCNIQDGSVLHVDPSFPMKLEAGVSIGHKVMLHGCFIGENTLIGINSVVLNGARIGRNCIIGANSLIAEGKEIPDGSLVMGSPGRVKRTLDEKDLEMLSRISASYVARAAQFANGLSVQRD